MCGICGIINRQRGEPVDPAVLLKMRDSLIHRGPDDAGFYLQGRAGIASRRLSILDLSPQGHMPMVSESGRYHIVHNGEVYNFRELRSYLETRGYHFRSQTDTEVVLYLYELEGPDMLKRLNGMFAFAIWDAQEQVLFAARDRMGIKPFYYANLDRGFTFASEPKALYEAGIAPAFDECAWPELLCFRYTTGEKTPYRNIFRLLPGYYLTYADGRLDIRRWYNLSENVQPDGIRGTKHELAGQFKELFEDSIALRRISDVPVGALLSGGLDSGAMAAVMASQAGKDVSTFTVRFREKDFDEGDLAREVAQRWQMDYNELFVGAEELPGLLEEAAWHLDEPLVHGHDPHLLAISRYARPRVTVLLSGEGSDEILAGYVRYRLFRYPQWTLTGLGAFINSFGISDLLTGRLFKAARLLRYQSMDERILFSSAEYLPDELGLKEIDMSYRESVLAEAGRIYQEPLRQLMYYEQHTYLQSLNDRNDHMTMGASIECRDPFQDYRLMEWAGSLPTESFYHNGIGKHILRLAMADWLPRDVLKHKKWGFGVPWSKYFREIPALRRWVRGLPDLDLLQSCPLSRTRIRNVVNDYLAGDDHLVTLVRQLVFVALWYEVCVCGRRQVLVV